MFKYLKKPIKIRNNKVVVKLNLIIISLEWHFEIG